MACFTGGLVLCCVSSSGLRVLIGDVAPELRSVSLGNVFPVQHVPRAPMPHVSAERGGALLGVGLPARRGVSLARTSGRELSSPQ